jgi:hypothetical protein
MKSTISRALAGLAIGLSLVLVAPVIAGAGTTTTQTTRTYAQAVHAIDRQFLKAVAAAKRIEVSQLSRATTQGQRNTARQRYRLAIAEATTTRDQALVALGPAPKFSNSSSDTAVVSPLGN